MRMFQQVAIVACACAFLGGVVLQNSIAAESNHTVTSMKGTWIGEFHQNSHESNATFPLTMIVDCVSGQEFSGTIDWPENNNCKTKIAGAFDGRTLKWSETDYIRGDDVVLHGLYVGKFNGLSKITGSWMDPKFTIYPKGPQYGTSGGTFSLRKN